MMEKQNLMIQLPNKDNIMYFNDDVDICTVSDFNKNYIEKCRTILHETKTAEKIMNDVLDEYTLAHNSFLLEGFNNGVITLPVPSMNLMLCSPGGCAYTGLSMYDTIKSYNKKVRTNIYVSGMCMSMGTIILCSVPLAQRVCHPNTTFMIHQVSSIAFGELAELEQSVEETKRIHNVLFDILEKNTSISKEKLEEVYTTKTDWFINAEEAVQYGLVSKIEETPIIY